MGGSTGGVVGVFPANGFNIWSITPATTVDRLGAGVAALGVAGCVVTSAVDAVVAAGVLWALDTVDAVVAVVGTTTLGVDSEVLVGAVVATTWLAATVPPPVAPEEAPDEADEFAVTPADVDVVRFGATPDAGCLATIGFDWRPWPTPTIPKKVFEPLFAPPVLTTAPGAAELVAPVDVDVDADPVDVPVPVDEPAEVFADAAPEPLADEPDAFEVDPDDVEDDPPEAGAAQATP